jgi:hypothetical protein
MTRLMWMLWILFGLVIIWLHIEWGCSRLELWETCTERGAP